MDKLKVSEVRAHHQTETVAGVEVNVTSLDDKRSWVRIQCSNGHDMVVEDHDGGSRAHCDQCGDTVDYGGYTHTPVEDATKAARLAEARALLEAEGELPPAPDRVVTDGDAASSAEA